MPVTRATHRFHRASDEIHTYRGWAKKFAGCVFAEELQADFRQNLAAKSFLRFYGINESLKFGIMACERDLS